MFAAKDLWAKLLIKMMAARPVQFEPTIFLFHNATKHTLTSVHHTAQLNIKASACDRVYMTL